MLKPHASQSIEKMALARQKDLNVLRHMLLHIFVCVCTKYGGGGEVWGGGHQWKDHCERVPTLTEELTDL